MNESDISYFTEEFDSANDGEGSSPLVSKNFTQDGKGIWHASPVREVVEVIVADQPSLISFYFRDYKSIFSQYNEDRHRIRLHDRVGGTYLVLEKKVPDKEGKFLPKGVYLLNFDRYEAETVFNPIHPLPETYIDLGTGATGKLLKDINWFFNNREGYKKLNLKHRRAALIYGIQGNGKTMAIQQVAENFVDGYVFYFASEYELEDLIEIQEIFKGEPVLFVVEEITQRVNKFSEQVLSFLDGELSWDNSYVIATTNYPEELEKNLVDRPGRFALLLEFQSPDRDQRKLYLQAFFDKVTDKILDDTKGMTMDFLREFVVRTLLNGNTPDEALAEIKEMRQRVKNSFKGGGKKDRPFAL